MWTRLAGLAAAGWLWGCDPGPPDGEDKVLFFVRERSYAEVGSTQRILVPRHKTIGGYLEGKGVPYRTRSFDYDFARTAIEVTAPTGSRLISASLGEEGYVIVTRCDAPGRGSLRVRIHRDGVTRYADGTFLECR
jgi:hypothetical protein